jgi:hypothetical protein
LAKQVGGSVFEGTTRVCYEHTGSIERKRHFAV